MSVIPSGIIIELILSRALNALAPIAVILGTKVVFTQPTIKVLVAVSTIPLQFSLLS